MFKSMRSIGLLIALSMSAVAFTGCSPVTKVTDAEVCIRTTFSGEIEDKVLDQGFHQIVVGDVTKVSKRNLILTVNTNPITVEKVPMATFVTKIKYGIVPANAALAFKTEKAQHLDVDGETFLMGKYITDITDASVQNVVSQYKALAVNDNRTQIESGIKAELNKRLKLSGMDKYASVTEVNVLKVQPHASIVNSSLAIVNSENALKTKNNELEVAKTETQIKKVLAENASNQYIDLQRAEAELTKAQALKIAAEKGTLNTMVIVPEKFTGIGQVK